MKLESTFVKIYLGLTNRVFPLNALTRDLLNFVIWKEFFVSIVIWVSFSKMNDFIMKPFPESNKILKPK